MIVGVRITGFQSHVNSYFNLGTGLNVITGPSGSGKTAIIRAVKWVAFNEPAGEAYVNEKVGQAEVEIELDNGVTITKRRKKGKTSYLLSTVPEPFEKSEVPFEVKQALGINKQTFGDFVTALNFAFQLDAPFLISETASAGAKILGKLAGTEAVDLAIKGVSKDTYAARQEKSQAEKDIEKIDHQLAAYMNLDELKEQLEACEMLAHKLEIDVSKVDNLKHMKIAYGTLTDLMETYREKLDRLAIVGDLEEELKNVAAAQARYDKLLAVYNQFNKTTTALEIAQYELKRLEGTELLAEQLQGLERNQQRVVALKSIAWKHQSYTEIVDIADRTIEKTAGVEKAGALLEGIRKANERAEKLTRLQSDRDYYGEAIAAWDFELDKLTGLEAADDLLKSLQQAQTKHTKLQQLQLNHVYYRGTISKISKDQEKYAGLSQADSYIHDLVNKQQRLADLQQIESNHMEKVRNLWRHENWARLAEEDLQKAQQELQGAWDEAGAICPLCEQPVSTHSH